MTLAFGVPDISIAERLLYSTVKLTAYQNGKPISTGTGFFVLFAKDGDISSPAIVTNKHVVQGADAIVAICHIEASDRPSGEFARCNISLVNGCVMHPDPNVDLCALPFAHLLNEVRAGGKELFIPWIDLSIIPSKDDWQYFDAIEEVIMIGCPNGISDETNNLPITRRGITASAISKRYNDKAEFMVDMACFPGSSGSPVFIHNRDGFLDRRTNSYIMGQQRLNLVGILYAGPIISNSGHIVLGLPSKIEVATMMHLGNVIRSSELHFLDAEFRRVRGLPPLEIA